MQSWFSNLVERRGSLIIIVVGLFVLIPGSLNIPILDRDEPRFSQATAEMMDRQDWIVPYFNDQYRFDKPPLTYWWMRVHYWVFGKVEIGARLHSIISTLLIALGIYWFGRRHALGWPAWMASIAWLTCFQVFQHGRIALADMPMVAAVFFASWGLYELSLPNEERKKRWGWFFLTYGSLGLGFLAKGPIALITPILGFLLYALLIWRQNIHWGSLRPLLGGSIVLAMIAAWGIPALIVTEGLFWDIGMGKHVIDRGVEAFNDRKIVPGYYLLTAFFSLFPWFAFLGRAIETSRIEWSRLSAFLIAWTIIPYIVFLFYSTQLPHYVMPAFPALLLWMMIGVFSQKRQQWGKLASIWFWSVVILWEFLIAAGLIWVLGSHLDMPALVLGMACILFVLLCLNSMVVAIRFRAYLWTLPFLVCISVSLVFVGSQMRKLSPVIPIAEMIGNVPENTRLVGIGFEEPSLVFYTGRIWDFRVDKDALLEDLASEQGRKTVYVILQHEQIIDQLIQQGWGGPEAELRKEFGRDLRTMTPDTHISIPVTGLNFARMRWSEIVVFIPMDLYQLE
jgi:4-amino-4-deoxy-L-arabinose transferase-like glycosyltransferase